MIWPDTKKKLDTKKKVRLKTKKEAESYIKSLPKGIITEEWERIGAGWSSDFVFTLSNATIEREPVLLIEHRSIECKSFKLVDHKVDSPRKKGEA